MKSPRCEQCKKKVERGYNFCSVACYNACFVPKKLNVHLSTDSQTRGYAGYNHGLDTHVENKGHWKQLVKEQNLRSVG